MFENSPFAGEVDAYIQAERQRQRDEAAHLADLEDALAAVGGEKGSMTTTNTAKDTHAQEVDSSRPGTSGQQEKPHVGKPG